MLIDASEIQNSMQLILKFIAHSFKIVIFAVTNFGRTMTKAIIRYLFMLFVAFLCIPVGAQNLKWRDMYQVKKKDTLFGIAKSFGLTLEELINANPEMKVAGYELKKGDYIFIPAPLQKSDRGFTCFVYNGPNMMSQLRMLAF